MPKAKNPCEIVFWCTHCSKSIIRDSREHDECIIDKNDKWFCGDCHAFAIVEE